MLLREGPICADDGDVDKEPRLHVVDRDLGAKYPNGATQNHGSRPRNAIQNARRVGEQRLGAGCGSDIQEDQHIKCRNDITRPEHAYARGASSTFLSASIRCMVITVGLRVRLWIMRIYTQTRISLMSMSMPT